MSENERFVLLFARHEGRLRRYVTALVSQPSDVDDVLQETAVALMRKFREFDETQPFFNWACRFAYYEVLQHRKQARSRRQFSDAVVEAVAREYQEHEQQSDARRAALDDCLRRLSEPDRRLIESRYAGGETMQQLAERLGEPAARLYRLLATIRQTLAACVRRKLALEGTG